MSAPSVQSDPHQTAPPRRLAPTSAPSGIEPAGRAPAAAEHHQLLGGFRITSLGILASRILGMLRDMATASLLGISGSGVMDALVVSFRLPNLFRRLFGEGAVAVSFLPIFTAEWQRDRTRAWQFASVVLTLLSALLGLIVIVGECICALIWLSSSGSGSGAADTTLLVGLSALMLPYLMLVCVAALISSTLHALGHFTLPALAPALLNVCWLAAAWFVAPWFEPDKTLQAMVLSAAVVVSGALQIAVQLPALRALGGRFDFDWRASRDAVWQMTAATGPMILGLTVTQINTFIDSLFAWGMTAPDAAHRTIAWLEGDWLGSSWLGGLTYPLQAGAASALYCGERLYQFPQGILGLAIATAIFPLLSRHAARGDLARVEADLNLGLRLVLFAALPAGAGLILLAVPTTRLLFEHGQFSAADTLRTARVISMYALGVWAYCASPMIVRAYYALGDRVTPVKLAAACVALDMALNLTLVWPLGEAGMALSTAIVATLQTIVLAMLLKRRGIHWHLSPLVRTTGKTLLATLAMALAGWIGMQVAPAGASLWAKGVGVVLPMSLAVAAYVTCGRLLRQPELWWYLGGTIEEAE